MEIGMEIPGLNPEKNCDCFIRVFQLHNFKPSWFTPCNSEAVTAKMFELGLYRLNFISSLLCRCEKY